MSQSSEIMADLDSVGGVIARAEAELAEGAILDLSTLENHIENLCTRIAGLPPGESHQAMQAKLLALVDGFGHLGRSIESAMAQLKTQLGEVSGRQQAASAYAKSSESG